MHIQAGFGKKDSCFRLMKAEICFIPILSILSFLPVRFFLFRYSHIII